MRDKLHSLEKDNVITVNGFEEVVNYTQKDNNSLKLTIMLYSGKEITSTPNRIELFIPDDDDLSSRKFRTRNVNSVVISDDKVKK